MLNKETAYNSALCTELEPPSSLRLFFFPYLKGNNQCNCIETQSVRRKE